MSEDDVTAIVVRFAPGEVTCPESVYPGSAPLARVLFRNPQVRAVLAESGVYGLSLVCPGWRHLEAPQYDIDGEEIPIEQMVDFTDVYRLEWDRAVAPDRIRESLQRRREVIYVEVMIPLEMDQDPLYAQQWGLHNTRQSYPWPSPGCVADYDINAPEAWVLQDTCTVKIGVIDTGIDRTHEDLAGVVDTTLWFGPDQGQEDPYCVTHPHGSAVAGIIAATGGNPHGIKGVVSPKGGRCLVSMRAHETNAECSANAELAVEALGWASTTAFPQIPVINNSYSGGQQFWPTFTTGRDAFRNAYLKGLFLVATSGNTVSGLRYPGGFSEFTTAVGAVRCDGSHTPGYNTGNWIDVAAPGGALCPDSCALYANIATPWGRAPLHNEYWGVGHKWFGGTSASAPLVAGIAGLLLSHRPDLRLTNDDLDGILKATAMPLGQSVPNALFGHGLVRADAALSLITQPHQVIRGQIRPTQALYVGTMTYDFVNVPCITELAETPEVLVAEVYELTGWAPFAEPALAVWPRERRSIGWRDFRGGWPLEPPDVDIDGRAHGNAIEVVPGSVTEYGCTLRGYTYKFYRDDEFVGWYPVDAGTLEPTCTSGSLWGYFAYSYVTAGFAPRTQGGNRDGETELRVYPADHGVEVLWGGTAASSARAAVFDVAGRQVKDLGHGSEGSRGTGWTWDGRDEAGRGSPAGVYFVRVSSQAGVRTIKVVR